MLTAQTRSLPLPILLQIQLVMLMRMVSNLLQRVLMLFRIFGSDNRGQDLVEYALIVAFAVGVVAVLTALYNTIKQVLTKANQSLQSAAQ